MNAVLVTMPFNSPEGIIVGTGFVATVLTRVVAALVSNSRKRRVPLARRKGTKANLRLEKHLAERREAKEGHGIFGTVEPERLEPPNTQALRERIPPP